MLPNVAFGLVDDPSEHSARITRARHASSFSDGPHVLALLAAQVDAEGRSGHRLSLRTAAQRTRLAHTLVSFDGVPRKNSIRLKASPILALPGMELVA